MGERKRERERERKKEIERREAEEDQKRKEEIARREEMRNLRKKEISVLLQEDDNPDNDNVESNKKKEKLLHIIFWSDKDFSETFGRLGGNLLLYDQRKN